MKDEGREKRQITYLARCKSFFKRKKIFEEQDQIDVYVIVFQIEIFINTISEIGIKIKMYSSGSIKQKNYSSLIKNQEFRGI